MIEKKGNAMTEEDMAWDDREISDDDLVEEGDGVAWFRMGMT